MPTRPTLPVLSSLNGRTVDIINTIRQYASPQFQDTLPEILQDANGDALQSQIRKFGDILQGYPALGNEFVSALLNRIAAVRVKSLSFNNSFAELKKGYLEFGEIVEEIFVEIAKVRDFRQDLAPKRELARTAPDIRAAFHAINWKVQYYGSVDQPELNRAFTSAEGVSDLIGTIISRLNQAMEVDDWFLFKYLIGRGILDGKAHAVALDTDYNVRNFAKLAREYGKRLQIPSTQFNAEGVLTSTRGDNVAIVADVATQAEMDVDLLSVAFNMDKADIQNRIFTIDEWADIPFDRYEAVNEGDSIVPFTEAELAILNSVKGFIADVDWFQVYDNRIQMTDTFVGSGGYTNYWLNVEKTWSTSPFANAVVLMQNVPVAPASLTSSIQSLAVGEDSTVLILDNPAEGMEPWTFLQTDALSGGGIAVKPYGAIIIPAQYVEAPFTVQVETSGTVYEVVIDPATMAQGDELTLSPAA